MVAGPTLALGECQALEQPPILSRTFRNPLVRADSNRGSVHRYCTLIAWLGHSCCGEATLDLRREMRSPRSVSTRFGARRPRHMARTIMTQVSHSGLLEPRGASTVRKAPGVRDKTTWSVKP